MTITVTAVNDAPMAANDLFSTSEDTTLNIGVSGVLGNDSDADGDNVSAYLQISVTHGTLALNVDGSFSYTPDADFNGTDTFTYQAYDGGTYSNAATVTITITTTNGPPEAISDAYGLNVSTVLNVPADLGVLANDFDPDGDPLTAVLVNDVSHGSLTLNSNGSFVYTPDAGYSGGDTFTYRASDGAGQSEMATVTIDVHADNTAPVAVGDAYSTDEDVVLNVSAPGVMENDTDADGDFLASLLVTGPSHGILHLNSDGSLTYTPSANFHGTDSFTYKLNDDLADSSPATVTITVNAVNDLPAATADAYEAFAGVTLSVPTPGTRGNDSDSDGDALTAVLVSGVSHGTLTLNADGSFTYTAESGFCGTDTFTYKANDGTGDSATVTVTITVTLPQSPTIASISKSSGHPGDSLTVTIAGTSLDGAMGLDFGPGIAVNSFNVDSPTQITAEISIDADAEPGTREIVVTTPEGTYTLPDAFAVEPKPSGGVPAWVWAILGVAVVAASLACFLLLRRRRKPG